MQFGAYFEKSNKLVFNNNEILITSINFSPLLLSLKSIFRIHIVYTYSKLGLFLGTKEVVNIQLENS